MREAGRSLDGVQEDAVAAGAEDDEGLGDDVEGQGHPLPFLLRRGWLMRVEHG